MLAISKRSWHYSLHCAVRRLWGFKVREQSTWSLCPYFQSTFWLTVATVILALPVLLGLGFIKTFRFVYKIGARENSRLRWVTNTCDHFGIDKLLQSNQEIYEDNPMWAGILGFALYIVTLASLAGIPVMLWCVLTYGIGFIPEVPHAVYMGICYFGNVIFWVFGVLGFMAHEAVGAAVVVGTWAWSKLVGLWDFEMFIIVLKAMAWIVGVALAVMAIGTGIVRFSYTHFGIWCISFLEMRANGFAEAKNKRTSEREKAREAAEQKLIEEYRKKYPHYTFNSIYNVHLMMKQEARNAAYAAKEKRRKNPSGLVKVWRNYIKEPVAALFWTSQIKNGEEVTVLGPLGILWEVLKGFKKSVCPVIKFVDSSDTPTPTSESARDKS